MKTIVLLILGCLASQAATVAVAWGKPMGATWQTVRVYERVQRDCAFVFVQVAEVPGGQTTVDILNVLPGTHTYVARGANTAGESTDSNQQTVVVPVGK